MNTKVLLKQFLIRNHVNITIFSLDFHFLNGGNFFVGIDFDNFVNIFHEIFSSTY